MPEIEQGLGELRVFVQRLLIEGNRVLRLAALLADQSGVVEEFGSVLAEFDQPPVLVVCVIEIFLLQGEGGESADRVGGIGTERECVLRSNALRANRHAVPGRLRTRRHCWRSRRAAGEGSPGGSWRRTIPARRH